MYYIWVSGGVRLFVGFSVTMGKKPKGLSSLQLLGFFWWM